jgi:uncharacterized protein
MKLEHVIYYIVVLGALNWGLIGIFDFNIVTSLFGTGTVLTKVVYVLVGLSAVYAMFFGCKKGK